MSCSHVSIGHASPASVAFCSVRDDVESARQESVLDVSSSKAGPVYAVFDLRNFLQGRWLVERLFLDCTEGNRGTFSGIACFSEAGAGDLSYHEEGQMCYGNHTGVARRYYLYRFPSAYLAMVRLADGRPFHDLDLRQGHWQSIHVCREDCYRGRIRAWSRDRWELRWEVLGPHKNLEIISHYFSTATRGRELDQSK